MMNEKVSLLLFNVFFQYAIPNTILKILKKPRLKPHPLPPILVYALFIYNIIVACSPCWFGQYQTNKLSPQMRLLVWTDSTRGRVRGHHVLETTSFNTLSRYSEHTNFNRKRFAFYQKYFIVICIVFLYKFMNT